MIKPSLKYKQVLDLRVKEQEEERANKLASAIDRKVKLVELVEQMRSETDTNKRYKLAEEQLELLKEIRSDEWHFTQEFEIQEHKEKVKRRHEEMKDKTMELLPEFKAWLEQGISEAKDTRIKLSLPLTLSVSRDFDCHVIDICLDELNKGDGMKYYIHFYRDSIGGVGGTENRPAYVEIEITLKNTRELLPFFMSNNQ